MNDNDLKGKIACELIIEATEQKGKRPTLLNFDELIDVVTGVVKKINYIPCCMAEAEQLLCSCDNPNGFKEMEQGRETCSKCKKPY